jgi:xylan 1,4-beta-xylosidase
MLEPYEKHGSVSGAGAWFTTPPGTMKQVSAICGLLALLPSFAWAQQYPNCAKGPLSTNSVCKPGLSVKERAQALVAAMTIQEKLNFTHNNSPGVPRLGVPAYNWWGEALHGVAAAPGVDFADEGQWSYATSFPQPITMAASFDDSLIYAIGDVISTEARAYNNAKRSGLDYWTPDINPFRDPRWGRGQETPGEDTYVIKKYVDNMVTGLQGGRNPSTYKIIATCKHFAAYDMEGWQGHNRYGYDAIVSAQDLSEYYMQPFQQCARDTKVGSIMCSYNAVNGVPSCANSYQIETVLRGHWNWTKDENYITSDCTAIENMFTDHHSFPNRQQTVGAAINAGVDVDCGWYNPTFLPSAYSEGLFQESAIDTALTRLFSALIKSGYFNPPDTTPWRKLTWKNVSTPAAEALALKVAEEGIVLLKNDGVLPLMPSAGKNLTILMAGGWVNATTQLQGNYAGPARTLVSPWMALQNVSNVEIVTFQWYESPLLVAQRVQPDIILWIDGTNEAAAEGADRDTIRWDNLQIDAVETLALTGIPTIAVHMGEQVDDSAFLRNQNVSAVVWAGYPGMLGGQALVNVLMGKNAPAARLPITQYPTSYVDLVPMTDMSLRPNSTTGNPGRTYKWYDNATVEFGYGLHYTNFSTSITSPSNSTFDIQSLVSACDLATYGHPDQCPFTPSGRSYPSVSVQVNNTGKVGSDFVALAFVTGEYGPQPYPLKSLVAYQRLFGIGPGKAKTAGLNITLGGLSRYDDNGNQVLYPGSYSLLVDVPTQSTWNFTLTGGEYMMDEWPQS